MQKRKKLLVIPALHNIEEIVEGISKKIKLTKGSYSDLEFRFTNNTVTLVMKDTDISDFTSVWLSSSWKSRDLGFATRIYLEHHKTHHTYVEKATSKITDLMHFALNKIPMPDTFFVDNPDISNHIDTIEAICGFPLIIKDIMGYAGKNSVLVENRKELISKSKKLSKKRRYLYQKFIANDYDWGILISNGKIVSGEKSYPARGEFRNNTHNGATEIFAQVKDIPKDVRDIALNASKTLKLSWSRSDIIINRETGEPYIMETNRLPGISSGTDEVSGAQDFLITLLQINP